MIFKGYTILGLVVIWVLRRPIFYISALILSTSLERTKFYEYAVKKTFKLTHVIDAL